MPVKLKMMRIHTNLILFKIAIQIGPYKMQTGLTVKGLMLTVKLIVNNFGQIIFVE